MLKAVEEYAAECSIIKVFASEMLDYVVDEGVQIHGGYGYHQDYAVERAYRDSRINRIFEGTNEINRLLVTGMLLKRAQRGQLGLVQAAQAVMAEILGGARPTARPDEETRLVHNAKKIALLLMGVALPEVSRRTREAAGSAGRHHRRGDECFAMESVLLRARQAGGNGPGRASGGYGGGASARCDVAHRSLGAHGAGRLRGRRCAADQHGGAAQIREVRSGGCDRADAVASPADCWTPRST